MKQIELLNGISSICKFAEAFESLADDIVDLSALENSIEDVISMLIDENLYFKESKKCNSSESSMSKFGICQTKVFNDTVINILNRNIPHLIDGKRIICPIEFDYAKPINVVIEVQDDEETSSKIAQYLLVSLLKNNNSLNFRCGDFVRGGNFFSDLYGLVTQLGSKSGGEIYTKQSQIEILISILEKASAKALTQIDRSYTSVHEHNRNMENRIEEYVNLLYLKEPEYGHSDIDRIAIFAENGAKNGMSFIIVGEENVTNRFKESSDLYIKVSKDGVFVDDSKKMELIVDESMNFISDTMLNLVESVKKSEIVDTSLKNNIEFMSASQTMNSSLLLRIPFAFDKNNQVQYFEIGGEAPSHALISGSTGSGKSVALHTLIMQIIYNYHPDDVEIWAIDYKAVEFDSYIDLKIPHFKVIAHDTSPEFSLSLIDLLYEEYDSRMKKFLNAGVKNISEYRAKMGNNSMPRIVVFIDEFQILTQAVQTYTGSKDYRTMLENLLRLTRAMGISFILCSQTIASGLSGLTDSARDQIGCRVSLKHDDDNEIRETLTIWGNDNSGVVSRAKNLRRGEGVYKRVRLGNETSLDGKPYEFKDVHIMYIDDELKSKMIETTKNVIGQDYVPKEEIYVRGGGRIELRQKKRHPIAQFVDDRYEPKEECVEWYPAAPTTLEDYYRVDIENTSGANVLLVGENDDLRESIVLHSLCGFLMNPDNKVYANFIDEEYSDRRHMIEILQHIKSSRLIINEGIQNVISAINSIKKISRSSRGNTIYLWYGLDKLKNELFLLDQEQDDELNEKELSRSDMVDDLMNYLKELNGESVSKDQAVISKDENLTYEECKVILKQAFEMGSENNQFHMVIFNNNKVLKKSGVISLENFENRIGSRMSVDDSFELFGSSLAIEKTDDNTVIFYSGSGKATPLRPYKMPSNVWLDAYNTALLRNDR